MTHSYRITGMTCTGCQAKVTKLLSGIKGISGINIDLEKGEARLDMEQHVPTTILQEALREHPKYTLTDLTAATDMGTADDRRSWFATYKPVLLIFAYVSVIAVIAGTSVHGFNWTTAMRIFMSGFFLVFSFFKMLDLQGFADSYSTYDIIAKRIHSWGWIYAFIEMVLGLSYALDLAPLLTNAVTFIVMSLSLVGVLQAVLSKKKIRCACLGTGFDLPMTTITVIEDALMIVMSAIMLLKML